MSSITLRLNRMHGPITIFSCSENDLSGCRHINSMNMMCTQFGVNSLRVELKEPEKKRMQKHAQYDIYRKWKHRMHSIKILFPACIHDEFSKRTHPFHSICFQFIYGKTQPINTIVSLIFVVFFSFFSRKKISYQFTANYIQLISSHM